MRAIETDLIRDVPSIAPDTLPGVSDDECLLRLARAVAGRENEHLDEVAQLISRLAVAIE